MLLKWFVSSSNWLAAAFSFSRPGSFSRRSRTSLSRTRDFETEHEYVDPVEATSSGLLWLGPVVFDPPVSVGISSSIVHNLCTILG